MENIKRFIPRLERCCMDSIRFSEDGYSFSWSVSYEFSSEEDVEDKSVEFGQEESRVGDFTKGSYSVQLPGNRLQIVEYFVDGDSGFVAKVRVVSNESAESKRGEEEE
ncbi:pro-resilin-like isoform X3 [Palaemon carinicauda]|uniref:pro-resilin-like isoform X3 n=1 Tax=Palaemon carinicauda TaxID=392227 RepID=UPI0035B5FEAF